MKGWCEMANEKRLIDANALIREHGEDITNWDKPCAVYISSIENAPTVDAVEVVRCKDCVNYCGFEHCKNGICDVDSVSKRAVYPNDFCSYGERKDNDDNR